MLSKSLAALLVASLCVVGGAWTTNAWADDSVTTGDGWVTGRSGDSNDGSGSTGSPPGEGGSKQTPPPKQESWEYSPSECTRPVGAGAAQDCERTGDDDGTGTNATLGFTPPTEAEVRVALRLPDPTPRFGPDPANNEWKMLVVGYPVWLWTDPPDRLSASATHDGLSMSLTAERTSTRFDMGDGHTVSCTATTEYPAHPDRYGTESPTCGYTYESRSKPGRDYAVTATTSWQVTWTTAGRTGSLATSWSGHTSLTIGELQSLTKG